MKRIAVAAVCLAAAVGAGYGTHPAEFKHYLGLAVQAALKAWDGVLANPVPAALALGTFLLTVVYHTAKGKSLRESVEVAATRVVVVPGAAAETPVVLRAKARATRAQLVADQIGLQNRLKALPEAVKKAEKDACYTEQAAADAELALEAKWKAHDEAAQKLEALRRELATGEAELAAMDVELKKLAEVV